MRLRLFAALFVATALHAAPGAFEFADVHISPHTNNPNFRSFVRDGRYEVHTATMVDLIRTAYGVDADKVIGGPSWLDTDRFDVIAKIPAGTTLESAAPMLQQLLTDRFGLAIHNDNKPMPTWILTTGKHPSMKESDGTAASGCTDLPSGRSDAVNASLACRNMTMTGFARLIQNGPATMKGYLAGNPVQDLTGLKGQWDFNIRWSGVALLARVGSEGISLFDAMDKQLGLKLEMGNAPQAVVVVESVSQKPTENAPGVADKLPLLPTEFDVIDIKLSNLDKQDPPPQLLPGGRLVIKGIRLIDLIVHAWGFDGFDDMVAGDPNYSERFDITAQAPSYASSGVLKEDDTMRLMVRSLLAERFKLVAHVEKRPVPGYSLLAANPKLRKADPENRSGCKNIGTPAGAPATALLRTFRCRNTTMAMLAEWLHGMAPDYIRHPVVDVSGLEGAWDFEVTFSPARLFRGGAESADPNGAISLFDALEKQVGLKLKSQQHTAEVVVVDRVQGKPTDN